VLFRFQVDRFSFNKKFFCPIKHKRLTKEVGKTLVQLAQVFSLEPLEGTRVALQKIYSLVENLITSLVIKLSPKVLALEMIVFAPKEEYSLFAETLKRITICSEDSPGLGKIPVYFGEVANLHSQSC